MTAISTNTPTGARRISQPIDDHRHLVHAVEESDDRHRARFAVATVAAAAKMHTAMISGSRSPDAAAAIGFCGTMSTSVCTNVGGGVDVAADVAALPSSASRSA